MPGIQCNANRLFLWQLQNRRSRSKLWIAPYFRYPIFSGELWFSAADHGPAVFDSIRWKHCSLSPDHFVDWTYDCGWIRRFVSDYFLRLPLCRRRLAVRQQTSPGCLIDRRVPQIGRGRLYWSNPPSHLTFLRRQVPTLFRPITNLPLLFPTTIHSNRQKSRYFLIRKNCSLGKKRPITVEFVSWSRLYDLRDFPF